jgi:hypothetical protein
MYWIFLSYPPREPELLPPLPNVAPAIGPPNVVPLVVPLVVPPNLAPPVVPPVVPPNVVPPSVPAAAAIVLLKSFTFFPVAEVAVTVYVAMNGLLP